MKQPIVFIVDDEPTNLGVLFEHAQRVSWRVLIHTSGASALKTIPTVKPDIILLDIMMPEINGFEVCQRLKADPATRDIPVIFVTALADQVSEVRGLELGAVDYISKPIQAETAIARIRTHLTLRQMQQELAEQNLRLQQEIAERQQAEEALAKERNLLRTLINTLPDHIYIKDVHSRFLLANDSAVRSIGCKSIHDLIGKTDFELFPQEAAAKYYADEAALFASGEPIINQEDMNLHHERDGIAWFQVTKVPFRDLHGHIAGLVGINHDISEIKHAQEQLRAAHQELQEKNAQLHELNASKDKFFSIIAHDLRTPFNTLIGFATLLLERIETSSRDVLKKQVETLLTSAERLFALLENLLAWSRLQRGLIQYEPQPLDLSYLASSTVDVLHAMAEQKQIALRNEILDHPWVNADYYMTTTVMRNLLSNALKFTPSGGEILLSARQGERDIEVSVSDTGVGMTPDVIAKLFRIDAHHTTAGTAGEHGSGLGLILCHDLVKKNGGTILVESELGNGTTFRFTLPRYIMQPATESYTET